MSDSTTHVLRFRAKDGKVFKAPAGIVAVEICNGDGHPAVVVMDHGYGHVSVYTHEDPEFLRYCTSFGITPSPLIQVDDDSVWDGKEPRGAVISRH